MMHDSVNPIVQYSPCFRTVLMNEVLMNDLPISLFQMFHQYHHHYQEQEHPDFQHYQMFPVWLVYYEKNYLLFVYYP
jgi:hypothetical protein